MTTNLKEIYDEIFLIPKGKRKNNFKKYFYGYKEAEFKKKIDTLMDAYFEANGSYEFDNEMYAAVTKDVVASYSSVKDTLISTYKEYNRFICDKYGITIQINYPPIPVSNTFERLMFIAKYLQDENHFISELPDLLWINSRTVDADLAKLRGNDGDPLQVCGKSFIIEEMSRSMGRISFGSTAHPFFLTSNLTQVIVMLEGLKEMSKRPEYKGYAIPMAMDIWSQLSDYGKNRIDFVSKNLMNLDHEWYDSLNDYDEYAFRTETECSQHGDSVLLYNMKNGNTKPCVIEYMEDDGTVFYDNVKFLRFLDDGLEVEIDGTIKILDSSKIIRSSFYKENMY